MVLGRNKKIISIGIGVIMSILCLSCIQTGKTDKNGRYVPIIPMYLYKDRKKHIQPPNLDLENIYRLDREVFEGKETYPFNEYQNKPYDTKYYMKFYPKGRCLCFGLAAKDSLGRERNLSTKNLDPANYDGPLRNYYFSSNSKEVATEGFYPCDGGGCYIRLLYHISTTGDTLTSFKDGRWSIYVKELLPDSLKQEYVIDW